MTPDIRRKLVGVLGMLASNHDGERAAAGLLATRLLKSTGLTWDTVIPEQKLAIRPNATRTAGWRATVAYCRERAWQLTQWERNFLDSLLSQKSLSQKQAAVLSRVHDKVKECDL
jgi:hypothetical protein